MVSVIAAVAAGGSIGGLLLGSLATALLCWLLLRRIGLPAGILFGSSYINFYGLNNMYGMRCLRGVYKRMMDTGADDGINHTAEMVPILHRHIRYYVDWYLKGVGAGAMNQQQLDLFDSLAGHHEDWRHLHEFGPQQRESALIRFVARTLYRRIIPDGDLDITLLPTDIVSTYQRILTKNPRHVVEGIFARPAVETEFDVQRRKLTLQFWRALTPNLCTETFLHVENHNLTRPNMMQIRGNYYRATDRQDMVMCDDDPRLPRIQATEELLIQALSHFFDMSDHSVRTAEPDLQAAQAREYLRQITKIAADIGITAFANPSPNELFWPAEDRRPGCDLSSDDGYLECFGLRSRDPIPGTETEQLPVQTYIEIAPLYNDSWDYENYGPKSVDGVWTWWTERLNRDPENMPDQALIDEREKRLQEYHSFRKRVPRGKTPGWQAASFSDRDKLPGAGDGGE